MYNVANALKYLHLVFFVQPTTPTKPVVFADWLSGISPPDVDTINKHVHDMVEVSRLANTNHFLQVQVAGVVTIFQPLIYGLFGPCYCYSFDFFSMSK